MTSYKYIAQDVYGRRKEGLTRAICEADVVGWLQGQGFTPLSVSKISSGIARTWRIRGRRRIRSAQLAAVFWQLATMVEGGITIAEALETVAEDIENVRLQVILRQILQTIESGGSLSAGISQFPKIFSKLCCALVQAGEAGGDLSAALRRVAQYFRTRDQLARKVKKAMAYPIFVLAFVGLVIVVITAFIVPRFRQIFEQMGGKLPAFTQAFLGFYDTLVHTSYYAVALAMLLLVGIVLAYVRTRKGHYLLSRIALGIPLIGKVLRQAFIVRFCRTTATLLKGGVPVLDVFDILSEMTVNDVMRSAIDQTRENIVAGSGIHLSMIGSGLFPNMVIKMVRSGEESGSLDRVLDRTADYYEEKVDATITTMVGLLEPVMIMIVGAVVLVVVLALYLPIFEMSNMKG